MGQTAGTTAQRCLTLAEADLSRKSSSWGARLIGCGFCWASGSGTVETPGASGEPSSGARRTLLEEVSGEECVADGASVLFVGEVELE